MFVGLVVGFLTISLVVTVGLLVRTKKKHRIAFAAHQTPPDFRSEFVANVSHELRTPLTSISGYLETIIEADDLDKFQQREFMERMRRNVERLKTLVDDLMALSELEAHPEALSRQWVSFDEIITPVIETITPKLKNRNQTLLVVNKAGSVYVDPFRVEQVLKNLIENAHRYSGDNCEIQVSAEKIDGLLLMTVKDNGVGIDPEHLPRLFERFYRVDKARSRELGGSGLGLAICKHIVQSHRGVIDVQSAPGEGTEFNMTIPLSANPIVKPEANLQPLAKTI